MSAAISGQTNIEQVLIKATSLLVECARRELEREVEAARESGIDRTAASDLGRMRELEEELRAIRRELGLVGAARTPTGPARQVSKFYEVPGQEDA
jgi:hypothetical protein